MKWVLLGVAFLVVLALVALGLILLVVRAE